MVYDDEPTNNATIASGLTVTKDKNNKVKDEQDKEM